MTPFKERWWLRNCEHFILCQNDILIVSLQRSPWTIDWFTLLFTSGSTLKIESFDKLQFNFPLRHDFVFSTVEKQFCSNEIYSSDTKPGNASFFIAPRYCGLSLLRTPNDGPEGVRYNESWLCNSFLKIKDGEILNSVPLRNSSKGYTKYFSPTDRRNTVKQNFPFYILLLSLFQLARPFNTQYMSW